MGRRKESAMDLDARPSTQPRVEPVDVGIAETREQVREALDRLPESQRTVIQLHWFDGLSMSEVADVVGASVSAVKVRAHRGYKVLRTALEKTDAPEMIGR
jgi:RNA polymerase sigma-70 factor (ECF subfamily)